MKKLNSEKGAITMITLITILFMISFLMTSYVLLANKVKTQKEMLNETTEIYKPKLTMEEIYNSYFTNDNIVPIYTTEQLLAMGSNEKINIEGKIYTFDNNNNTIYLLKADLEFNANDLELEADWIPPYEDTNFAANFDWNGHTVKVTELSGNIITYDGKYLVTKTDTEKTITLTKATKSNLVDLKIYGNSIQDGTPTSDNPVEIGTVGEPTINLFNPNAELEKLGNYLGFAINITDFTFCMKLKENKTVPEGIYFGLKVYRTENAGDINWFVLNGGMQHSCKSWQNQNYKTEIIVYGANQENWDKIIDAFDILLVEGSYTEATIPSYEPYGYKIPITVTNKTNKTTVNIYLDEPLRKVGSYCDYIDFRNKKLIRNVEVIDETGALTIENSYKGMDTSLETQIDLPDIQLYKGTNIITVDTEVEPSKTSVTYNAKQ